MTDDKEVASAAAEFDKKPVVVFTAPEERVRRVGVLVLGMHRSGSSAITRMLKFELVKRTMWCLRGGHEQLRFNTLAHPRKVSMTSCAFVSKPEIIRFGQVFSSPLSR